MTRRLRRVTDRQSGAADLDNQTAGHSCSDQVVAAGRRSASLAGTAGRAVVECPPSARPHKPRKTICKKPGETVGLPVTRSQPAGRASHSARADQNLKERTTVEKTAFSYNCDRSVMTRRGLESAINRFRDKFELIVGNEEMISSISPRKKTKVRPDKDHRVNISELRRKGGGL